MVSEKKGRKHRTPELQILTSEYFETERKRISKSSCQKDTDMMIRVQGSTI